MNIYVGNLDYKLLDGELKKSFEAFGTVTRATIIMDRQTGASKGYGFVDMPDDESAKAAIEVLNGSALAGRNIRCNEARARNSNR